MSVFNFENDNAINSRLEIWQDTVALIHDKFIFGTGPGNFKYGYVFYQSNGIREIVNHAHNEILELFSEVGLFCGAIIFMLYFKLWISAFFYKKFHVLTAFDIIFVTTSIFVFVHSLVDFPLRIPSLLMYQCIVIGCYLSQNQRLNSTENEL